MIPYLNLGFAQIPTYFLVISLSVSGLLMLLSSRVDAQNFDRKLAYNIALILMISGFLGGRLFHIFYEEFAYYKADPVLALYFWNGGFVYLGGLLLAWPVTWIYCRLIKISFLKWGDFFAPLLSLAHALGRVGCILSGCCFGQYCELPWGIAGRHPTAIYLTAGEFVIFLILIVLEKRQMNSVAKLNEAGETNALVVAENQNPGQIFFKWIFLHSLLRYTVEFYRDDFRGSFFRFGFLGSLSVSQVICFGLMVLSAVFFTRAFFKLKFQKN